jgi:hypothetical protein
MRPERDLMTQLMVYFQYHRGTGAAEKLMDLEVPDLEVA